MTSIIYQKYDIDELIEDKKKKERDKVIHNWEDTRGFV